VWSRHVSENERERASKRDERDVQEGGRKEDTTAGSELGIHVIEVVVDVADTDTEQVVQRALVQQVSEGQNDPRQIGRREREEAEEVEHQRRVSTTPHVDDREGQRGREEHDRRSVVHEDAVQQLAHEPRCGERHTRAFTRRKKATSSRYQQAGGVEDPHDKVLGRAAMVERVFELPAVSDPVYDISERASARCQSSDSRATRSIVDCGLGVWIPGSRHGSDDVQEEHVEDEVEAEVAVEQKGREETPELEVVRDQVPVEVQREGRYQLEMHDERCEKAHSHIGSSHRRYILEEVFERCGHSRCLWVVRRARGARDRARDRCARERGEGD